MKKIEAIIHRDQLLSVKGRLAEAGIDSRLTVSEVSGLDAGPIVCDQSGAAAVRKCVSRALAARRQLKIELITGDRQAHRAVDAILEESRVRDPAGTNGNGNHGRLTVMDVAENMSLG